MTQAIMKSIARQISKADFITIPYENRAQMPSSFIEKAWSMVDKDAVLDELSKRLEKELVDRLVNAMASEIATDIKQVLSVKERREAVRSVVRDNIDKLTQV